MSLGVDSINGLRDTLNLNRKAIQDTLDRTINVDDNEYIGIEGYVTNGILQETIARSQTLTTNPVEDGSVVTDHIIKDPLILSMSIEIADTEIDLDKGLVGVNKRILESVGSIELFLPKRTQTPNNKSNWIIKTVARPNRAFK